MKKLLLSFVLVIVWFWPIVTHGEDGGNPDPNIYQENEININKSIQNNLRQKEEIPEEQKQLTFEETEAPNGEQIEKQLFQTAIQETNTIQAKTAQIGLFSNPDPTVKLEAETQLEEASSIIMILMIVAVSLVLIAMFVLILPKLQQNDV